MKFHEPVLVPEILQWMNLKEKGMYCDCTVGGGGHLNAMLQATRQARFIGVDWDAEAITHTREQLAAYSDRISLHQANFINLDLILDDLKIHLVNGILFDLGVSYHQLVTPERGFSFEREGGLLMQMSSDNIPLIQKLRVATKLDLAGVLRDYGDVRNAMGFARLIHENRNMLRTTLDLRQLIERITPRRFLKKNLHKVFQAFRIWVNNELTNLKEGITRAIRKLARGARILVISYHSGEDRIVKNLFRELEKENQLRRLNKKVIKPGAEEVNSNPSARSAKLRVAERCAAS